MTTSVKELEELETLNLVVFQNYESKNDIMSAMRIAFDAARKPQNNSLDFDQWLSLRKIEFEEKN